jgi:TetR/AcrR family transcriptional regulator, cholesterol catabolism regulator
VKTKKVSKVLKETHAGRPLLRTRIVEAARGLFLSRGFVRVTADDIAGELGISKATLYKEFASKEDILRGVVRAIMAEIAARVDAIMTNDELSFVERLVALFAFVGGRLSLLGPEFLRDIEKSAPAIWREIEDFRRDKVLMNFKIILAAGHDQGVFRGDIDDDLLVRMFIRLVEGFVNPAEMLRSGRTPAETFESVIKVFFQGILTDKGRLDFSSRTPALFEPRKEGAS